MEYAIGKIYTSTIKSPSAVQMSKSIKQTQSVERYAKPMLPQIQQYYVTYIVFLYLQHVDTAIFRSVSKWRKWKMIDILQTPKDKVMVFDHLYGNHQWWSTEKEIVLYR